MKKILFLIIPILLTSSCGNIQNNFKTLEIISFQPFYYQSSQIVSNDKIALPQGVKSFGDLIPTVSDYIATLNKNINYLSSSTKSVSLRHEDFAKLGKNQIILFEGHGSCVWFDNEAHSVIWTGNEYDESKKETEDYQQNYIINAEYQEGITNFYIDKYCGDLTGSIVYLDNCFSGRDSTLAKAFLDKGAAAVIGHTNTTQQTYGNIMLYETLMNLTRINSKNNTNNTIFEALSLAKEKYGKDDSVLFPFSTHSEPILFGNPNWKITL